MEKNVLFVGLDVHKETIEVAIAEGGRNGEVRRYGKINGDLDAVDKLVRKLQSSGKHLEFVYEAGPCGYVIHRHLMKKGMSCMVAAPSMIPKRSGERIKNDPRDAEALARLHRAGELTKSYVPLEEDEAVRDLTRCREDAKAAEKKSKQRLNAFLLRHGMKYKGKSARGKAYMRWLAGQKMPHPAQQIVLQEYIDGWEENQKRVNRLTRQIEEQLPQWRMAPMVEALQALKGVSLIVAVTTIAEIGDIRRFSHPRELVAYLGLVPSEHSSGEKQKRGGITKTGNGHVRRVLVEGAWAYRFTPRKSQVLLKRQEKLTKEIKEISWKAQLRLCGKYWRLLKKGKIKQKIVAAIARELAGFMWAIAWEVDIEAKLS